MDNKAVIRQLFDEVLNAGSLELLDSLIAARYVEHNPAPGQTPGAAGVRIRVQEMREACSDLRFVLEDLVDEGSLVATRYHWTGTPRGPLTNISATGKSVTVTGMDFYHLENGQIVEHWHNIDELGLLRQLGVLS
jgi:steroid delta-isomerase-like uncharacterized protein